MTTSEKFDLEKQLEEVKDLYWDSNISTIASVQYREGFLKAKELYEPHWTILDALKAAYKKHVLEDDSVGWTEVECKLLDALCNLMGNDEFIKWNERPTEAKDG